MAKTELPSSKRVVSVRSVSAMPERLLSQMLTQGYQNHKNVKTSVSTKEEQKNNEKKVDGSVDIIV